MIITQAVKRTRSGVPFFQIKVFMIFKNSLPKRITPIGNGFVWKL